MGEEDVVYLSKEDRIFNPNRSRAESVADAEQYEEGKNDFRKQVLADLREEHEYNLKLFKSSGSYYYEGKIGILRTLARKWGMKLKEGESDG